MVAAGLGRQEGSRWRMGESTRSGTGQGDSLRHPDAVSASVVYYYYSTTSVDNRTITTMFVVATKL